MKIRFFKLALAAVLLAGVCSCAEKEITRVPAKMALENADEMGLSTLTFSNRAESKTVSFTADGDWYIRIPKDCDWLSVSPREGTGDASVTFTTSLYEEEAPRAATVAFVCDNIEQKALLNVTQLQKFYLDVDVENPVLGKTGGEFTFPVTTNGTYDVNLVIDGTSEANWLTLVESGSKAITFNAAAIQGKRNAAVITLTCKEDPTVVCEFTLSQKNLQLSFNNEEAIFKGEVSSIDLPVTVLNIDSWTATVDADWCTVSTADGKVVLTTKDENKDQVRTANVIITTSEDEEVRGTIAVTQYPAGVPHPDLCNIVYDKDGVPTDLSPKNSPVTYYPGNSVETITYCEPYQRYAPSYATTPGSNLSATAMYGYYVDYTDFQAAFNDGYSIEAVFSIPVEHTNGKETKAFGGTGQGGFAIMLGSTARGSSIEFIQHSGKGWCFGSTGIIPEPNRFYHVIGVYDPATASIYTYVDGELAMTVACPGIKHMVTTLKKLGVGANHTNAAGNGSWNGTVVLSRVYDAPMTAEQVKAATIAVNMPAELYTNDVVLK